jgi:hypothetical protein
MIVFHVSADAWGDEPQAAVETEPGVEVLVVAPDELPVSEFLAADREFAAGIRDGHVTRPQ